MSLVAVVALVTVAYVNLASTEEIMGLCYRCSLQHLENNEIGSPFAWIKSFLQEIKTKCTGLKTRRRNITPRPTTGSNTDPQRTTTEPPTTTSKPPTTTTEPPTTTNEPPITTTEPPTTTTDPPTTNTDPPTTNTEPPLNTTTEPRYADCQALLDVGHAVSGVYNITPAQYPDDIEVYCDLTTDSNGWMVFQRRVDGAVNFTRSWAEYRDGFGDKEGEFWLGNEILRRLTEPLTGLQKWQMRVDLTIGLRDHKLQFGVYDDFHVHGENYTLHVGVFTDPVQTYFVDALSPAGQPFSTYDRDNDAEPSLNCADELTGGWWFNRCTPTDHDDHYYAGHHSNLNGEYSETSNHRLYHRGIVWSDLKPIIHSEMKMRRV